MSQALKDQVAVVVGASSGMGKQTALSLARAGASVVVAARSEDQLWELAAGMGAGALAFPADVENPASVERLVAASVQRFGRIDLLVYATGTNIPERGLEVLTPETWDMMVATNLSGAFHCTRAVLPVMRSRKAGLILYVGSACVQIPDLSGVSYQASKHGLVGLAHGTFQEERENGIRTTVIFPGLTDTPLVDKRPAPTPPEVLAKALQPEDVAAACLFVASLPPRARVPELTLMPAGL